MQFDYEIVPHTSSLKILILDSSYEGVSVVQYWIRPHPFHQNYEILI